MSQVVIKKEEIRKDCNKEDYDNWKRLWWLKQIVMIEKDCNDWKGLW